MNYAKAIRLQQVERMNGRLSVWWHYNRMTLVVLLSALAMQCWLLHIEREYRKQAQADAATLAHIPLLCYGEERPTTFIIAGSSQQLVDDALRKAGYRIDQIRGDWFAAKERNRKK